MIRVAQPEDLIRVAELTHKGLEELGEKPSPNKVFSKVQEAYTKAPCVIYETDEIHGMWGLIAYKPYWTEEVTLSDYMFYVEPEHRSFRVAKQMCDAVKAIANNYQLDIELNYMAPSKFEEKKRLFEIMGFTKTGIKGIYHGRR